MLDVEKAERTFSQNNFALPTSRHLARSPHCDFLVCEIYETPAACIFLPVVPRRLVPVPLGRLVWSRVIPRVPLVMSLLRGCQVLTLMVPIPTTYPF
mmetsp:Transcript_98759/g.205858  ORF Transcript_98759/g.205858 Transcript_98759/m.205858 type:complete len:97 (-) Transcript_98759:239-529(-)